MGLWVAGEEGRWTGRESTSGGAGRTNCILCIGVVFGAGPVLLRRFTFLI